MRGLFLRGEHRRESITRTALWSATASVVRRVCCLCCRCCIPIALGWSLYFVVAVGCSPSIWTLNTTYPMRSTRPLWPRRGCTIR